MVMTLVTPAVAAPPAADDAGVKALLDQCPCAPSDFELYSPFVYPSDLPLFDAPDPGLTEAQLERAVRRQLVDYLRRRDPSLLRTGLRLYRDRHVRDVAADPRLRGALILLLSTPAEPAIDYLLDERDTTIKFVPANTLFNPDNIAEASTAPDGSLVVSFNEKFQHEALPLLAQIVFHESLHQDPGQQARPEEATARLVQFLLLTQMLAEFPEITDAKTDLLRGQLTQLLALVFNSITVFEGRGDTILPGGAVQVDDYYFEGPVASVAGFNATPGNQLLVEVLANYGYHFDEIPHFSEDLLASLIIPDMAAAALTPQQIRRAALAMTLPAALFGGDEDNGEDE